MSKITLHRCAHWSGPTLPANCIMALFVGCISYKILPCHITYHTLSGFGIINQMAVRKVPSIRGLVKEEYLAIILEYFVLFQHKIICCGHSLEVPCWGTSKEYPQHMIFFMESGENNHRIIIVLLLNKTSDTRYFSDIYFIDNLLYSFFALKTTRTHPHKTSVGLFTNDMVSFEQLGPGQ